MMLNKKASAGNLTVLWKLPLTQNRTEFYYMDRYKCFPWKKLVQNVDRDMHLLKTAITNFFYREEKGQMKADAQCNFGYEMPWSEIAAFHLHRYHTEMYPQPVLNLTYVISVHPCLSN